MAGMNATLARVEALVARLRTQPELAALPAEVANKGGALATADAAEDSVVARVRWLGQAAVTAWAQRRCAAFNAAVPPPARRRGKKRFFAVFSG